MKSKVTFGAHFFAAFVFVPLFIFRFVSSCDVPIKPDIRPPVVYILQPEDGATVSEHAEITCEATDNRGVSHVELWVDGSPFEGVADSSRPYSLLWNTMSYENNSSHTITVRAVDNSGNRADSDPITLIVDNQDVSPTAVQIHQIIYQDNSFHITWSKSPDNDFSRYTLFESYSEDMSGSQNVFTSQNRSDTSHVVTGISANEVRYYQVEVRDTTGLTTLSEIRKASSIQNMVLHFDGSDDYINLGNTVGNNVRSIEFWFKLAKNVNFSLPTTIGLLVRDTDDERSEFGFFFHQRGWRHPGHLEFYRNVSNNFHSVHSDAEAWFQDIWYHVAATIDPDHGMLLYINGERQQAHDFSTQPTDDNDQIVSLAQWGDIRFRYFNGSIYELRIWKRALDEAEIVQNMNRHLSSDENGLKAYYRLNEGTGQMIKDYCTNSEIFLGTTVEPESDDPTWITSDLPF